MNDDLFMNDTFDNFTFTEEQNIIKPESVITSETNSEEISINDSLFLTESFIVNNFNNDEICSFSCDLSKYPVNLEKKKKEISQTTKVEKVTLQSQILTVETNSENLSQTDNQIENNLKHNNNLADWGLPNAVLEKYEARNIKNMFSWQVECLSNINVLKYNSNLVYSAPTSAGKTLVAEILAMKTLFERQKKVIFILPFISIVREKMYYFQDILGNAGIRVEGYMGSYNPPGGFQSIQVAICTIEKANSLINRLLEEGKLSDIGAILVDELHLLGDPSRGYLLELLLTKLRYISLKDKEINIQIIGMSATLPNLNDLANWLGAELYSTNFRPIPLHEQAHVCGEIYNSNLQLIRKLTPLPDVGLDTDNVLQLCLETIQDSCSVLIFCPTKQWCENLSQQISTAFFKLGNSQSEWGSKLRSQLKTELIMELLEQLKYCPVGLDCILRKTVSFGVAFHHAGLTMDERDIIENGFRNGALRVLVATSTLSSGVNLPARRVIIRTPTFHGKPIDTLIYRQMIGRAGRMGKDAQGESILICQKNDYKTAKELMSADLHRVESCLEGAGKLKRAILEVIASGVASTPEDVELFTNCTLLAIEDDDLCNPIQETVDFLLNCEFIRLQKGDDDQMRYVATSLGKACLSSSMAPDEGLALFTELEKARQCFVLETELHLIYLVTPYSACHQWANLDWMMYMEMWERLPSSMKRVGELVGVSDYYLINATRGKIQTNTAKLYHKLLVHKRFFVALALQDLVNEKPLIEVCNKFNCNRGMLQSLQQSASSFAGMVTSFSRQLGWSSVEILISQFQDRLQFGVSRDLLDLMRLPILNGKMARTLYNSGIETLVQLANSDVNSIENILHKVMPFESEKGRDGETDYDVKQRNKLRTLWVTGKEGLTEREAAEMLVKDARDYLRIEMGLIEAKWESSKNNCEESEIGLQKDIEEFTSQQSKTDCSKSNNELDVVGTENKNSQTILEYSSSSDSDSQIARIDNPSPLLDCSNQTNVVPDKNSFLNIPTSSNHDNNLNSQSSDNSLFGDDSFTLQLSSSNDSGMEKEIPELNTNLSDLNSGTFLEKAFSSSFNLNNSENIINDSDDILTTSLNDEESRDTTWNTQKRLLCDSEIQPPTKRQKIETINDFSKMEIVNVCTNDKLFEIFSKEVKEFSTISLSIACSNYENFKPVIGLNVLGSSSSNNNELPNKLVYKNLKIDGFALSPDGNCTYYLSLQEHKYEQKVLSLIKSILKNKKLLVKMFDSKEQLKLLKRCCDISFYGGKIEDPLVAVWLIDPEGRQQNLQSLAINYCPELIPISKLGGNCKGIGSIALETSSSINSKIRSSVETILTWHVLSSLKEVLEEKINNYCTIYEIEMKNLLCLTQMEIYGMGVDKDILLNLIDSMKDQLVAIEAKAYSLAGRKFQFTSSADVAKVIGMFKGRKVSTRKEILEQNNHPISDLVLQWRKLSCTLTKMIYPLMRSMENYRISGSYIIHTATGRITMHEPNVQNLVKDFNVINPLTKIEKLISCRSIFVAKSNSVLVSADYRQLELRILAHFARDDLLCDLLKVENGDVFRTMASLLNDVNETQVDDSMRQKAKHLCYAVIYGIGNKALAQQFSVDEIDAREFMESFRNVFPNLKQFINNTVSECRQKGYVQTILGRRRYLPHITESNSSLKAQAERQAVNTTIQGSAADIVKQAMVRIEEGLNEKFAKSKNRPQLILHLHDELIYEVPKKYYNKLLRILKEYMENSIKLLVPLPVKFKSGPSWGLLTEVG